MKAQTPQRAKRSARLRVLGCAAAIAIAGGGLVAGTEAPKAEACGFNFGFSFGIGIGGCGGGFPGGPGYGYPGPGIGYPGGPGYGYPGQGYPGGGGGCGCGGGNPYVPGPY